jgi:hypothetical protein
MLVIVLIALSLITAAVLIGRTDAGQDLFDRARNAVDGEEQGSTDPTAGADTVDAVTIASVTSFDPEGTGPPGENNGDLPLAWDGDPSTAWTTEGYDNRDLAPKSGVGIVVDLGDQRDLGELAIASSTQGWSVAAYVGDGSAQSLGDWGEPVASAESIGGDTTLDLDGASGRAVLLWITDLGERPGDGEKYRANISELTVSPA